jgi:hypothetical protein
MRLLIAAAAATILCAPAFAHDDGRYAQTDPSIKKWVEGLTDDQGAGCCATADGYAPEEVEWDIDTGKYRVRIDGKWVDVPDGAVIKEPNRLGYAVVWYWRGYSTIHIRCFLPGSGS